MVIDIARSALIAIDVQNDFCPGGALAVADGDQVVAPINRLSARFAAAGGRWWPPRTGIPRTTCPSPPPTLIPSSTMWWQCRYRSTKPPTARARPRPRRRQTLWPDHCVQGRREPTSIRSSTSGPSPSSSGRGRGRRWIRTRPFSRTIEHPHRAGRLAQRTGAAHPVPGGFGHGLLRAVQRPGRRQARVPTIVFLDACRGVGAPSVPRSGP
jgi:hypothetical protein